MKMLPLLCALPLAGCAVDRAGYPSLAPRAAERLGFNEPAIAAPAPLVADPALNARLATLATTLATVTKGFDADAARARRAAGVGTARTVGSDAWLDAQSALAVLDDWRAQASALATELEALAGERAASVGTPYPALDRLRERASAEAGRQSAGIAAIGATLPLP
ncbi:MAG: hypothetical protein JWN21_2246 [Sphingomonas bacterium]|uniref:hypothetical protein n=1 Tax=Sphingomonas bacterium TaxID=1895847 RepID=UPI0026394E9A|nr:hypothetical protein [Sphingomonas bacterium]MDB5696703.1 hypothetical protein [Sphingomonas bacterium]